MNSPGTDDYMVFLNFLNQYNSSKTISEIFVQFDDTREIFRRFLAVILFHLHAFNFKAVILFANCCLMGTMYLFYKSIAIERTHKDLLFLVVCILVLQFEYYDATLAASASTAAICPIFFTFSAFYFFSKESTSHLWMGILCSLLYVAENTIGFLVLIMGILLLLQKGNKKGALTLLAVSIPVSVIYFYNFQFDLQHHLSSAGDEAVLVKIGRCMVYGFIFIGSSMQFFNNVAIPLVTGIILWGFLLFLFYKKYFIKNAPVFYTLLFLLSISLLIPFFREKSSLQPALSIRYSFFSIMAIAASLIAIAELVGPDWRKKLFYPILSLSLLYHISGNLFFLPEAVIRKEKLMAHLQEVKAEKPVPDSLVNVNSNKEKMILKEALKCGYYDPGY